MIEDASTGKQSINIIFNYNNVNNYILIFI